MKFYIQNGFKVILWNYRGYGKSTGNPSLMKSISDAEQVYEHAQKHFGVKIQIAHGYSIGGPCAINLALKYPKKIKLLIADRTFSKINLVASN